MTACEKHRKTPAKGYSPCPGCEVERLRALLDEAADCIAEWGAYASGCFQQKHDLAGDVRRFREAGAAMPANAL